MPASARIPRCQRTVFACSPSRRPSSRAASPSGASRSSSTMLARRSSASARCRVVAVAIAPKFLGTFDPNNQGIPRSKVRFRPDEPTASSSYAPRRYSTQEATRMASHPTTHAHYGQYAEEEHDVGFKLLALFLGLAVGVLAMAAVWMGISAQNARDDARAAAKAAPAATTSMPGMAMPSSAEGARPTPSFAGIAPANADALAAAHKAYPAASPATTPGPVLSVNIGISHRVLSIAPGIKYDAWTFSGGVPGPVIHARQGQTVRVTLTNNAPMPHSVDFHAARVAPD